MPRLIGWREWAALPDLGIKRIHLKADSGARTSALHAQGVRALQIDGEEWVEFALDADVADSEGDADAGLRRARVIDCRTIKDSGGHTESRVVIETTLKMAGERWPIELTLTDRENMGFRMLLGRTAMSGRFYVDPEASYLLGAHKRSKQLEREEE